MIDKNYPAVLIPATDELSKSIYKDLYIDLLAEGFIPKGRTGSENQNLKLVGAEVGIIPKVPISTMLGIVKDGGYFKGIKVGLRIFKEKLTAKMPTTIKDSTFMDDKEIEVTRTYREWIDAGNILPVEKLDGTDKIMKASRNGQTLDSTELDKLNKEVGVEVLDWDELIKLIDSVDYKVESQEK